MKNKLVAGSLATVMLLATLPAHAGEYVFGCRNLWTQAVTVTIEAESVDAARQKLKKDKDVRNEFSLDNTSQCVFRSEIAKPKKKVKKRKTEDDPAEGEKPSASE